MPTMPSFFLLLLILLAPFTSMRACLGRLLRDHQSQPENQGTAVIHGKQQVFIESNSLKRDQWRTTSGGAAATTKSLKDKKTLITSSKAHENDQEAVMKTVVLSGAVRIQTHVSVSWRIPRNMEKKHKGHPGFNVDYAGPRTHPPSHN